MQRLIDANGLMQSFSRDFGLFYFFTPGKVNKIQFGLYQCIVFGLRQMQRKDCVGPGTSVVHGSGRELFVLFAHVQYVQCVVNVFNGVLTATGDSTGISSNLACIVAQQTRTFVLINLCVVFQSFLISFNNPITIFVKVLC